MDTDLLKSTEYSFICAQHPLQRRVLVTHSNYDLVRGAGLAVLRQLRSSDLPLDATTSMLAVTRPLIHLSSLPLEWADDNLGFGHSYSEALQEALRLARLRDYTLASLLEEYRDLVDRLARPDRDSDRLPPNPMVLATIEAVKSLCQDSHAHIGIPIRARHVPCWRRVLTGLPAEVSERVDLRVPSALRLGRYAAVLTVGPLHPWNRAQYGWPYFLTEAPVAPLLVNIRWEGDTDRIDNLLDGSAPIKWQLAESTSPFSVRASLSSCGVWDRLAFEDLFAPGRNRRGRDLSPPQSSFPSTSGRLVIRTSDGNRRTVDTREPSQQHHMLASVDGRRVRTVAPCTPHATETLDAELELVLLMILDDEHRAAAHARSRRAAPQVLQQSRQSWKQLLRLRLDDNPDALLDHLRLLSGGDKTLCSLHNLRSWADDSLGATHGPRERRHFEFLLDAVQCSDDVDALWHTIQIFRSMGRRLGSELSEQIRDALALRLDSITSSEWDALDSGDNVYLDLPDVDVVVQASRIDSIEVDSEDSPWPE